jgi:hypothetical protein
LLKPEALDLSGNAIKLENTLDHVQDKIANLNFGVQVNAIRRLEGLTDDEPVNFAINRLNHILSSAGVSDNETVGQYMVARLLPMIRREVELPEEKENMLIKKILGVKGINIRVIRKDLNPDQAAAVSRLANENNKKVLLQTAIQPLEDIVHDFSVEMIRNLQSAFVLDQDAEVKRLQDKLRRAKEDIEASGNEEAMKILKRQMKKIKEIENITTAAEGFVFDYDGYTYKFTGNFAPMNQLLGLFEYGRGDIPPMRRSIAEAEDNGMAKDIIAVYPGRFQPMGRHHYETYEEIARQYGVENTFVATSDKVSPPKSPLNFEEKKEVMIAHGIPANQIVKVKNPYYARELSDQHNPDEVEIVYFVGEKDMKENPRFSKTSGTTKEGYDWRLEVAPHVSFEIPGFGEMCGTSCRAALGDGDQQLFTNIMGFFDENLHNLFKEKFESGTLKEEVQSMPLGIFLRLIEEVMNEEETYTDKLAAADSGTEGTSFKDAIKEEDEEDEEELEEASGVGAVTGYSGPGERDSEPETLIREGIEQMNRHEIYEEIRLRKIIREGIKKINAKIEDEKQQEVLEEQRLRSAIRKLLLIEKTTTGDTEPAAHQSTGINFLEKLLKNIIPTLETDYKTLTSSEEQRESFRNHILRAIQDTIAPLKITTQAEPEPGSDEQIALAEEELDNVELTVKVEDDPDFIDIRSDKEIEDEEAELSDEPSSPEDEKEQFGIEGENEVGRNAAFDTFKKISKQIVSKYDELTGSADDQKLFYEYLLTNIKLYFDKFENDMGPVEEPESPDYDPNQMDQEAESAEVEPETIDQEAEMGLGA